jgi:hypothetical protein
MNEGSLRSVLHQVMCKPDPFMGGFEPGIGEQKDSNIHWMGLRENLHRKP